MLDAVLTVLPSLALATVVTAHLATVYGLLFKPPRYRALLVLLCPPLLPRWAIAEGMKGRAVAFVAGGVIYGVSVLLAVRK